MSQIGPPPVHLHMPPYQVLAWEGGEPIGAPYLSFGQAVAAADGLGHTGSPSRSGMYYIPRAYVVDRAGELAHIPVYLTGQEPDLSQERERTHD